MDSDPTEQTSSPSREGVIPCRTLFGETVKWALERSENFEKSRIIKTENFLADFRIGGL